MHDGFDIHIFYWRQLLAIRRVKGSLFSKFTSSKLKNQICWFTSIRRIMMSKRLSELLRKSSNNCTWHAIPCSVYPETRSLLSRLWDYIRGVLSPEVTVIGNKPSCLPLAAVSHNEVDDVVPWGRVFGACHYDLIWNGLSERLFQITSASASLWLGGPSRLGSRDLATRTRPSSLPFASCGPEVDEPD